MRVIQKLREERGYCYHISSSMVTLADAGAITICAGLDTSKLQRAMQLILRELRSLCSRKPGRIELKKARDYTIGQTLIGLESTTNQMMWMGESLLGYGKILPLWIGRLQTIWISRQELWTIRSSFTSVPASRANH